MPAKKVKKEPRDSSDIRPAAAAAKAVQRLPPENDGWERVLEMLRSLSAESDDWVARYADKMQSFGLDSLSCVGYAQPSDFNEAGIKPMHRRRMSDWARCRFRPPLPLWADVAAAQR